MIIVRPDLEADDVTKSIERVEGLIKKNGGEIDRIDRWGKRKLAYPIDSLTEGQYLVVVYKGENETIKELDRVLKISDEIVRHMTFRLPTHQQQ